MKVTLVASVVAAACVNSEDDLARYDACAGTCTIILDTLATLGQAEDTIWPSVIARAARVGNYFYVGGLDHPGSVAVYALDGRLLRTFGRSGEGPGEYSSNYLVPSAGPGDTVSIYDLLGSRRTIVDSAGNVIRTHPVPFQFYRSVHIGPRLIAQADIRTPDKIGWLLHALDSLGNVVESYVEVPAYRSPTDATTPVSNSIEGGVWLANATEYRLRHYDSKFVETKSIRLDPQWYRRAIEESAGAIGYAPRTIGIWQSPDSLLWVLFRVGKDNVAPRPPQTMTVGSITRKYYWKLDAIVPRSGERIASANFAGIMSFGMGDGVLYEMTEQESGRIILRALVPNVNKGAER